MMFECRGRLTILMLSYSCAYQCVGRSLQDSTYSESLYRHSVVGQLQLKLQSCPIVEE